MILVLLTDSFASDHVFAPARMPRTSKDAPERVITKDSSEIYQGGSVVYVDALSGSQGMGCDGVWGAVCCCAQCLGSDALLRR